MRTMNYPIPVISEALNHLLSRNIEAKNGYAEVEKNIESKLISKWMLDFSKERKNFIEELKSQIIVLGGKVSEEETFLGQLHHHWINLKSFLTDNSIVSLMEECIRGEQQLISDYEEVLQKTEIPYNTKLLLQNHILKIQIAIENLKIVKSSFNEEKV